MAKYSVKQLSKLAGVSVRTLHHYDQIDLLKPAFRSEKGYRFYERNELLLLQQILFYRELGFSLQDIHGIINDTDFDMKAALENHKKELKNELSRIKLLLKTVDKTIVELKNKETMTDKEIYVGFTNQQLESMRQEVKGKWGEKQLLASEERIRKLGKDGWNDLKAKGEDINQLLAELMDLEPSHKQVQQGIELHFRQMNAYYEVSKERYLGLADMYVQDERFTAYYEKYKTGLAKFLQSAIQVFCANGMKVK